MLFYGKAADACYQACKEGHFETSLGLVVYAQYTYASRSNQSRLVVFLG
jgi:hypothetical protein